MSLRPLARQTVLLGLALQALWPSFAQADSWRPTPRLARLLPRTNRFIAQDSIESVTLYSLKDGSALRRFVAAGEWVKAIGVTPDERFLAVGCAGGSLGVWDLKAGKRLWWHGPDRTRLGYVYEVSFAANGRSLVACNGDGPALVCETRTGKAIRRVGFSAEESVDSAGLSPDGRKGVLMDAARKLYTFEVAGGEVKPTGVSAAGFVRYSADGKFLAFYSRLSLREAGLAVAPAAGDMKKQVYGRLWTIRWLQPAGGSSFLATGVVRDPDNRLFYMVGVRVTPGRGLEELWRWSPDSGVNEATSWDEKTMLGVCTDPFFLTRVVDLRRGVIRFTIDNTANYRKMMEEARKQRERSGGLIQRLLGRAAPPPEAPAGREEKGREGPTRRAAGQAAPGRRAEREEGRVDPAGAWPGAALLWAVQGGAVLLLLTALAASLWRPRRARGGV